MEPQGRPDAQQQTSIATCSPRSGELLKAYLDLQDRSGPLHAQCVADMGTQLHHGTPLTPYQDMTPSLLRHAIMVDDSNVPTIDDPRDLDPHRWTMPWSHLCQMLDDWDGLAFEDRLRGLQVLLKLGFWNLVVKNSAPDTFEDAPPKVAVRARRIWFIGRAKADGIDNIALPTECYQQAADLAMSNDEDLPTRVVSAVNLLVYHARSSNRSGVEIQRWDNVATRLVDAAPTGTFSHTIQSVYWRGRSIVPFLEGNHDEARSMLDHAEAAADEAILRSSESDRLAARENKYLLTATCARAATAAQQFDVAERYYLQLIDQDPLGSKVYVLYAEFLAARKMFPQAADAFTKAYSIGAPHTGYARHRAVFCRNAIGT